MPTRPLLLLLATLAGLLLCSCSGRLQQTASDRIDHLAAFSPRDLLPLRVPIVTVRPADLQDLPLGSARALAFNRKRSTSSPGPHATFIEPLLPLHSDSHTGLGVLPARPE